MELESKLLEEEYLRTRFNEIKEIKQGLIRVYFKKSDRENSISLYVSFWRDGWHGMDLRISDHSIVRDCQIQFLIDPSQVLTKKKKERFMRTVMNCVTKTKNIAFSKDYHLIKGEK